MSAPPRRYALDPSVRRAAEGRLLSGGVPSRLIRLTAAGARAVDTALAGGALDAGGEALARRLAEGGMLHPLAPLPTTTAVAAALTTIVPVRDGGPALGDLVAALAARGEVIVVDDRSADGSAALARAAGARVLANAGAPGPAGARNTGLRAAATELVAFLDADCSAAPGWCDGLAALLGDDPGLALVAPRVRSAPGPSRLARYESGHSPLDLGAIPSLVGPRRRISYLPAAALVGRRAALLEAGGFDERLRYGEDVDLVWRLLAAGWSGRYVAECEVVHRPRPTLARFARQRYGYGGSATALEARHPGAAAPLRIGRHSAAVWAAAATFGPKAAGATALGSALRESARGSDAAARRALAEAVLRGHASSTRHLARALSREWLPLGAAACLVSQRVRRLAAAALVLDAAASRRPGAQRLDLPTLLALKLLDNAAYSAGLWRGAAARRSLAALLPKVARTSSPSATSATSAAFPAS
jgi:mycofactocin system glycosyltransferase